MKPVIVHEVLNVLTGVVEFESEKIFESSAKIAELREKSGDYYQYELVSRNKMK